MRPPPITKGNWLVYDANGSIGTIEADDGTPIACAQIIGGLGQQSADTIATRKANARFLAASKKMAEGLQEAMAIAKIEGTTLQGGALTWANLNLKNLHETCRTILIHAGYTA